MQQYGSLRTRGASRDPGPHGTLVPCQLRAHAAHTTQHLYSITSSAPADSPNGTSRPSVLAVFMLITNSNLLACITGSSAGFSPLSTRPAYTPTRRYTSAGSMP